MKKIWIVFFILAILLSACQEPVPGDETTITDTVSSIENEALNSSYIKWYGRHTYLRNREYFYHTATGFKVQFYGRLLEIELILESKRNDIYYSVAKNGEDLLTSEVFVQSLENSSLIIDFETFDFHSVEIVKKSEPEDGVTSLKKISTNGYLVEVEEDEQLHFLVIGASGISGHGALGNPGQQRTTANSSSLHSFGYLTAKAFDGSYEFVSNSGWGLAFGYNDTTGETNIAKAYDYMGIDTKQHIVEIPYHHEVIPDYIIINIGGNDYTSVINKSTGFERTENIQIFKTAVAQFILKLRSDAPNAHIFWTMTEGSLNGSAASDVISQLDQTDQSFVHVVTIKKVGDDGDLAGANNHASYITHQKSAQVLIDLINQIEENFVS